MPRFKVISSHSIGGGKYATVGDVLRVPEDIPEAQAIAAQRMRLIVALEQPTADPVLQNRDAIIETRDPADSGSAPATIMTPAQGRGKGKK